MFSLSCNCSLLRLQSITQSISLSPISLHLNYPLPCFPCNRSLTSNCYHVRSILLALTLSHTIALSCNYNLSHNQCPASLSILITRSLASVVITLLCTITRAISCIHSFSHTIVLSLSLLQLQSLTQAISLPPLSLNFNHPLSSLVIALLCAIAITRALSCLYPLTHTQLLSLSQGRLNVLASVIQVTCCCNGTTSWADHF